MCALEQDLPLLYLVHKPAPPLGRFIQMLWYARAPQANHRCERILPVRAALGASRQARLQYLTA